MLVDTHCHLADEQFDDDRSEVVERARASGVGHVIVIADSVATTNAAVAHATQLGLSATAGVHPHVADSWGTDAVSVVGRALEHRAVVAIGETGLDYHYDHSPRDRQRIAFRAQLDLATASGLPVVVHARAADADMADMLQDTSAVVVLHSFSSGAGVFETGLAISAYFSFSGMVTFKSWKNDEFVTACPTDRLLIETDSPYLAPVPHRGKRNEPAFVRVVAARVAELRGIALAEIEETTTANAIQCFGARLAHTTTEPL